MAGEVEKIRVIDAKIPDHWERATFRQLLKDGSLELVQDGNHGGAYPKPDEFESTGIPMITGADLNAGAIDLRRCSFLKLSSAERLRIGFAKQGDVLLTHKGTMGKTAIVPPLSWPYIILNPQLTLYRVSRDGRLNGRFLKFFFDGKPFQAFLERISGNSTISTLSLTVQKSLEIPLPPLAEQKAIAAVLGALDDKIELNRRMNATLEAMAKALFQSWFVDFDPVRAKLDGRQPTGVDKATAAFFPASFQDSPLGHIPTGWDAIPLYDTAQWVNGAAFKNEDFCATGKGLPVIKIAELKDGISAQTKWSQREAGADKIIDTGDLVYSWSGSPDTSLEAFLWSGARGLLNQHIFKVIPASAAQKRFVYYLLHYLRPVLVETARNKQTTGLGHVTVADMKRLRVCMPSKAVLTAFDQKVAPIFNKAFTNTLESRTLATLRDALLPKLLSGNLLTHFTRL